MKQTRNPLGAVMAAATLVAASSAWAADPSPAWQKSGSGEYVCGGISDEGMDALHKQKGQANTELLFTEGAERAWVTDVAVSIKGGGLKEPMQFRANGPSCFLKLPPGTYTVDANYGGKPRTQTVKVGGASQRTVFNWQEVKN
ncbi:MAG: hypothetical protein QM639_13120 [Rhodocyclaceae bacterium]